MSSDKIVAVGLLTRSEVELLGASFDRLWPVDDADCFTGLLKAIDEAENQSVRIGQSMPGPKPVIGGGRN